MDKYWNILVSITIVLFIIIVIKVIYDIRESKRNYKCLTSDVKKKIFSAISGFICIVLFILFWRNFAVDLTNLTEARNDELIEIKEHIESGYEVYLDGELIDGTKIEVSHYYASINEEKQEVYLTKK